MEFLIVIIVIVVIGVALGVTKNRNEDINRTWASVAQKLGVTARPASLTTSPLLSGVIDGHDLAVDIKKKHSGKHRKASTRFRLGMPPLQLGLNLKSESFFDGMKKALGAQDIEVGDPAFDDKVMVKGGNEAVMREYLTPERRRVIAGFLGSYSGATITDDEISLSSNGYVRSAGELLGTIEAMLALARALGEVRDDPDAEEPRIWEAPPPPAPAPAPEPAAESVVELAVEPSPLAAPAGSPDVAEFCDVVFAPGKMSFDANQAFRHGFEGKRVVWSGTLDSTSPFSFDFDFGTRTAKAVLTIRADDSGGFGSSDIKAVIGLPDSIDGLEQRIGQRLTFAGTLKKVDGFAKKVFLTDAELG